MGLPQSPQGHGARIGVYLCCPEAMNDSEGQEDSFWSDDTFGADGAREAWKEEGEE